MRKIPIKVDKPSRNYWLQLLYVFTDLWLYIPTDLSLQFKVLWVHRFPVAERLLTAAARTTGWVGVLLTLPLAVFFNTVIWCFAVLQTIGINLMFTFLVVIRKLEFVPADEMVQAELQNYAQGRLNGDH